jgi:hypothetical protein
LRVRVFERITVKIIFNLLPTLVEITVSSMSLMMPNLAVAEGTST